MAIYLLFHSFNATEGRDGLGIGYLLTKFSKVVQFAPYKRTSRVQYNSVQFKIIESEGYIFRAIFYEHKYFLFAKFRLPSKTQFRTSSVLRHHKHKSIFY